MVRHHAVRPRAGALPHPRHRPHRLHHLPLFDPVGRAGAADRAVGRLRDHRQVRHPFPLCVFPDGDQRYQGVKAVDPKLLEVGRAFRCSERQLWSNIVLPAALPFIVTGIRLAVGRGMIGMVLADLYTAISGIGYLIVRTASTCQVDKMFVPIVTLGLLGVALTALSRWSRSASRRGRRPGRKIHFAERGRA